MKTPRKNQNNQFICEECNAHYDRFCELSRHIGLKHNKQYYYDKYLKEQNEDVCPICGNKNPYLNRWDRGYKKTCSYKCANILRKQLEETTKLKKYRYKNYNNSEKRNETNIQKYGNKCPIQNINIQKEIKEKNLKNFGVENPFQSLKIRQKGRKTMKEKYGAEYTWQSDILMKKIKETNIRNLGVEFPVQNDYIHQKIKESTKKSTGYIYNFENRELMNSSMMKKFGVKNSMQIESTRKNHRKTMKEKYGVEYSMQNIEIFTKAFKTRIKLKQYKNTILWYQGSYELDFLDKFYDKFSDMQRGPSVKYMFNKKHKVYFPDFYIPSLNLIVEIKNSYLAKRFKTQLLAKKKATIANGFNYIMIVNKHYNKFKKLFYH